MRVFFYFCNKKIAYFAIKGYNNYKSLDKGYDVRTILF